MCRVLDYSKYKYEQAQKQKAARRHQQQITVREIKFRPKIAQNDYDTKKGHVSRFLKTRTRSRSRSCSAAARSPIPSAAPRCSTGSPASCRRSRVVEQSPVQDGRNMTMMLAPSKAVLAGEKDKAADGKQDKPADGHRAEGRASRRRAERPSRRRRAAADRRPPTQSRRRADGRRAARRADDGRRAAGRRSRTARAEAAGRPSRSRDEPVAEPPRPRGAAALSTRPIAAQASNSRAAQAPRRVIR